MCEFRAFGKFVEVVVVPCCMSVTRASDNSKSIQTLLIERIMVGDDGILIICAPYN